MKFRSIAVAAIVLTQSLPTARASDGEAAISEASALVNSTISEQSERYQGVRIYVVRKNLNLTEPGFQVVQNPSVGDLGLAARCLAGGCGAFIVESVDTDFGKFDLPRALSPTEIAILTDQNPDAMNLKVLGLGLVKVQETINEALGWPSPVEYDYEPNFTEFWGRPDKFLIDVAFMLGLTAQGIEEAEDTLAGGGRDEIEASLNQFSGAEVRPGGTATVDGTETKKIVIEFPHPSSSSNSGTAEPQWTPTKTELYIDPVKLVLLRHRFEGIARQAGESRDFFVEVTNSDFRNPPGCGDMLEPYRTVNRMGGMLDDEQMAQMREAQQQLAEFDRQLASLSAQERQMMESMIGDQMEAVRNMADDGAIEVVQEVDDILCDPDLKALYPLDITKAGGAGVAASGAGSASGGATSGGSASGGSGSGGPISDNLLVRIQLDLVTLGYEPGNTDGLLDTMTQVAISQFQAESGLEVTGEPSQEVADALAAAVGQ